MRHLTKQTPAVSKTNLAGEFRFSVVVIGRNEGKRLLRCLKSVGSMNWPRKQYEIIYVDSDSRDGSPAKARALGARVIEIHPEFPTVALTRKVGWRAARRPFILFLDGDTILHPDFLKNTYRIFEDPKIAIICGHRREIHPEKSIYNRVVDLDWICPSGPSQYCGGDALVRRSVLEKVGGYDNTIIAGEEPEMCARIRALGYVILHVDHPMTQHDINITRFSQYWRRAIRTGYGYAEVEKRLRGTKVAIWTAEVKKNANHIISLIGVVILATILSTHYSSFTPFFIAASLFWAAAIRSAYKARWKSPNFLTLVLYGLHSQFQHIPIFLGRVFYQYNQLQKRSTKDIEYKGK